MRLLGEDVLVDKSEQISTNDTKRLVEESRAGDRGAFDELVRLHQKRAMQMAIGMLGDANEAAEVVQAGFVKAYLKIDKLKEPKRFEVWLLRIITNAAISQRRAAKHRPAKREIDHYEDKKTAPPGNEGIVEELERAIQRAMLKLTKKEAQAISLFGLEDLPHKKVAEIMGCSVEAVRWHVFRARQKLKVLLKEYM